MELFVSLFVFVSYGCYTLPFSLSLSLHTHTYTYRGRLVKLGIPHGAVHSCVRQAEHPLFMPHTHRLFTWVSATHTHAYTCTLHTCAHRGPQTPKALVKCQESSLKGYRVSYTHRHTTTHKDKRHLALRHCVSLRAVLTPRSFSFQMERYE